MKKSSSLESLQTMVQEVQMSDNTKRNVKVVRGRGCDQSFKTAVNKDGPQSIHELRLETCMFTCVLFIYIVFNKNILHFIFMCLSQHLSCHFLYVYNSFYEVH